jgi:hypothetical protein
MFSLFKSNKEKQLIKLGFQSLIDSYYEKVKSKEWSKDDLKKAIDNLYEQKKSIVGNADNVNVSTRQSFVDDEVLVALNLQNIQQEFIDYDFIYSTLLYDYKNHKKIHTKALKELSDYLHTKYKDVQIDASYAEKIASLDTKQLIDLAMQDISSENANELAAVFTELKKRSVE